MIASASRATIPFGSIGPPIALAAFVLVALASVFAAPMQTEAKLIGAVGIGIVGGLLGFGMFLALHLFPRRTAAGMLAVLRAQTLHFQSALDNMSQGLCMFDAANGLLIANNRFFDLFGIAADKSVSGMLESELMALSDGTDFRRETPSAGSEEGGVLRRANGIVISVSRQPMANGGEVVTYEDITVRRWAEATISHMVRHDALTNLPNRLLFHEALGQALGRAGAAESPALLLLDIDNFKAVNDTLGYAVGDELLKAITSRLRDVVRATDIVARLGGDEFAIVQTKVAQPFHATALAVRLIEAMTAAFDIGGQPVVVGTSIGIALAPADGTDSHQLLKHACMALFRTKADGRGGYRYFEAAMDARMQLRRTLEIDLRKAVEAAQFELFYQQVVDSGSEQIVGFEALLRWNHPERGLVEPNAFVPLAEETGLIVPIGEWVLLEACREAAGWPGHLKVAVNLSPVQFASPRLVSSVRGALVASGLAPGRLELEITESILLQDNAETMDALQRLHEIGVRISMDDFGTGYSSLSYLRKFPFDKIKIDRCFINELTGNDDSVAIIRAVSAIGHSLGMLTTAEGVETRQQFDLVRNEGCTQAQGFLFGVPLPAWQIPMLLADGGDRASFAAVPPALSVAAGR